MWFISLLSEDTPNDASVSQYVILLSKAQTGFNAMKGKEPQHSDLAYFSPEYHSV
jgi:hypothetical protein